MFLEKFKEQMDVILCINVILLSFLLLFVVLRAIIAGKM
jgi:hypothetical protein